MRSKEKGLVHSFSEGRHPLKILLILLVLGVPSILFSQMGSQSYEIRTHTKDEGGRVSSSSSYLLHSALGQPSPIGISTSGSYEGYWGYIYTIPGAPEHPCQCGDINCDGVVSYADLSYLGSFLFAGGPPPIDLWTADLNNCDGAVTYADLTYLAGYLFSGGPNPQCCVLGIEQPGLKKGGRD